MPESRGSRRLATAAIGAVAGLAAGLLGIGGGLVMVPLLTLVAGLELKRAVGTSLVGVVTISAVAVATELAVAPANISFRAAALLAVGAIAGSWAGSRIIVITPTRRLTRMLALVLVVGAVKMSGLAGLLWSPAAGAAPLVTAAATVAESRAILVAHLPVGFAAGVLSAMFGIGGGILAVPALAVLHPDWVFQACRATSLAMIVPTAIAGAFLHRKLRHVDLSLAWRLSVGSLVGTVVGVVLANRLPGRPLELGFAALLLLSAFRLVRRRPRSVTDSRKLSSQ